MTNENIKTIMDLSRAITDNTKTINDLTFDLKIGAVEKSQAVEGIRSALSQLIETAQNGLEAI